jgi:hypothetical protein
MRTLRKALFAGAAAVALGFSGAALARTPQTHVMTLALPGGGVAQIRYTGNVAPQASFSAVPAPLAAISPMPAVFGPASPFAALDRISAEMDRQAAAMLRQAQALAREAQSGRLTKAALRRLPPGSASYTFVSTMSGNSVCSESVEITAPGNGAPPRVVRHRSGNCAAMPGGAGSIALPTATPPAGRPDVVWTGAHGARPYAGLVREIPPAQR